MFMILIIALLLYYYFKSNVIAESNNDEKNNLVVNNSKSEDPLIYPSNLTLSFQSETLIINTSSAENSKWFFFPIPGNFISSNDNYQLFFDIKERECVIDDNTVVLKKYISNISINNIELKKINITNTSSSVTAINSMLDIINPTNDYLDENQNFVLDVLINLSATIIYFNQPENYISHVTLTNYLNYNKPKYYSTTNFIYNGIANVEKKIIDILFNSESSNHNSKSNNLDIYYQILGFNSSNGVTESDIKNAYKKLSIKYHPDNKETGDSEQFKLITNAYNFLKKY